MADHYAYRVVWSAEDGEFVATCAEFPSLSHLAPTRDAALRGAESLVQHVLADLLTAGEPPPEPLASRSYSGEFLTRIPPQLHMRLALEAAEAGISLNRLAAFKLAMPVAVPKATPRRRQKA